jgi:hypothetical protein
MSAPWTQGPWTADVENSGGGLNVVTSSDGDDDGVNVAWTSRVVRGGRVLVSDTEAQANARLAAAAPDLAEALRLLLRLADHDEIGFRMALRSARAALAKAGAP